LALRIMYRVIAILGGALALSACSSLPDFMKPAPIMDTVHFESDPPGAKATTSNGQTCQTPCALALLVNAPLTVTFTLNGYQPDTESIEPIMTTDTPQMRPNPVTVELTPAPPPPKPMKKPMKKKPVPKKKPAASTPAAGPKPAAAPAPAPAIAPAPAPTPMSPAPAETQTPSH
jgi:outer membrane biosynthesis protein TonB